MIVNPLSHCNRAKPKSVTHKCNSEHEMRGIECAESRGVAGARARGDFYKEIGGFDIAVDDSLLMGMLQGRCRLNAQPRHGPEELGPANRWIRQLTGQQLGFDGRDRVWIRLPLESFTTGFA